MKSIGKTFKLTLVAGVTAMSCSFGHIAMAQDGATVLEELIVTARKIDESVQDIPLAITAFSADDIAKRSIEELEDVALLTPGFSYEDFSNGGFGTPIIRGASQFTVDALEQNVSTFLDGVYIPRNYALDVGTIGFERIEIVKGPQSALYGANSFLGAINYVSGKASLEKLNGDVKVTIGDDGRQDLSANISVPFIANKLAVKVSVGTSEYDGDRLNSHPAANSGVSPGTDDSLGGWDKEAVSISLVAKPTENIEIDIGYHNFDSFTEGRAQTRLQVGDLNCGGTIFGGPVRGFCGELPGTPLEFGTNNETGFLIDPRTFGLDNQTEILRASIAISLSEQLSLTYQGSNIEGDVFSAGISDRSPLTGTNFFGQIGNAFTILPVGGFDYDSHELRLEFSSESGVYAMLGAYSQDGFDLDSGAAGFIAPLFFDSLDAITEQTLASLPTRNNFITETETNSIFGRLELPFLNDKLKVSVEGRYTDETKEVNIIYNDTTVAAPLDDSYFTPRVSVDYHLNDNQLIYISAARGVKSGGQNQEISGGLTLEEREFDADENTTIEIGTRNALLGGRMNLNATVYNIDWTNLQVSQAAVNGGFFTTSIVGNLGEATSKGLELELDYAVSESLTLNAGLALNDASYGSGTISQRLDRGNICDDIVCSADGDISGNSLPRSSDTQWNIGAQYDGVLGNDMNYFMRMDVVGQSEQFVSEANIGTIPERTLVNLRAGIDRGNWSAELWVKNATDEDYVSNAFYIPNPFFVAIVPSYGNLRRIGVNVNYSF